MNSTKDWNSQLRTRYDYQYSVPNTFSKLFSQVADLGYDLTFSTEIQEFGVTEVRDLIADGRNVIVSE